MAFAGRANRLNGASPRAEAITAELRRFFPQLSRAPIEHSWSGPIDRTRSGVPFFYREGSVVYGAGYSGVGVSQAALGGRILASLALRRDDDWARCGLVGKPVGTFPPEPIRHLGARLVRAGVARKEEAEDVDRQPGPITSKLAALAPPGFVAGASSRPKG